MISLADGKIGSREVFVLVVYMISSEAADLTPTILFEEAKTSAWMIPGMSGLILLLPFLVLASLLSRYKDKSLMDVIYAIAGKYAGFLINMVLFLIMFMALVFNSRNYVSIIQTLFMPMTPSIVIYVLMIAASWFIASRGLDAIGRTALLMFIPMVVVLATIILLVLKDFNFSYIFPVWGNGIVPTLKSAVVQNPVVADIFLLPAIYHQVRSGKNFKIPALLGYAYCIVELTIFYIIYLGLYDYPSIKSVLFPFQQMTLLIHTGRYVINFEALYLFFWIIVSLVRYSIYLYLTSVVFSYTLKLKSAVPALLPFAMLTVLLGMIPENIIDSLKVYRQNILHKFSWLVFLVLPFILWLIHKVRGGGKNEAG